MCEIKIALSKLSEKNFSRKWPSLWEKTIDTLENRVVKLPCRRSMIPGSRMWLWTFWWIERINAKLNLSPRFRVGCVSIPFGRALAWHARGQRFDPAILHQKSTVLRLKYGAFLFDSSKNRPKISRRMNGTPPHFAGAWMQPPISDAALFLKMLVSILTAL